MPYTRRYKKRRRRRRPKQSFGITRSVPAAPLGQVYKFHTRYYSGNIILDPASGGIPDHQVFSLNGLYDPDISNVGHQPIGFDQLMLMYNHYTVIGCKATVWIDSLQGVTQMVTIQVKDTATTSNDVQGIIENGNNVTAMIGQQDTSNGSAKRSIKLGMNKYFGRNVLDSQGIYSGDSTKNPAEQVYLHISNFPDGSSDYAGCNVKVLLEYVAILTEPKQLATS